MMRISTSVFVIGFLAGCGATDYEEDPLTVDWREFALAAKDKVPEISVGTLSTDSPIREHFPQSESCPPSTLCIRGPYFGEEQLAHLSILNPELVSLRSENKTKTYSIKQNIPLLIESDLFVLNENVVLKTCSAEIKIISSEASGSGIVDSSASGCNRKSGGEIVISSETATDLKLVSNGEPGRNGSDASPIQLAVLFDRTPVRLCIDAFSCLLQGIEEWKAAGKTISKDPIHIHDPGSELAERNIEYLRTRGVPIDSLLEECNRYYSSLKDLSNGADRLGDTLTFYVGGGGCFFSSTPGKGKETGLISRDQPTLMGIEKLKAQSFPYGEPGEAGGRAGKIEVIARKINGVKADAVSGQGGTSGKGVFLIEGLNSPNQSINESTYQLVGDLSIEFVSDGKSTNEFQRKGYSFEVKKIFQLDQAILGQESRKLQLDGGGKAITTGAKDGPDGVPNPPSLIEASVDELITKQISEHCPKCAKPKALSQKHIKK